MMNDRTTTTDKTITLCIPGNLSIVADVLRETDKAICVRNSFSPDARGVAWLPKSALKRNEQYSYGDKILAYDLARWCRLDRNQQKALGMLA